MLLSAPIHFAIWHHALALVSSNYFVHDIRTHICRPNFYNGKVGSFNGFDTPRFRLVWWLHCQLGTLLERALSVFPNVRHQKRGDGDEQRIVDNSPVLGLHLMLHLDLTILAPIRFVSNHSRHRVLLALPICCLSLINVRAVRSEVTVCLFSLVQKFYDSILPLLPQIILRIAAVSLSLDPIPVHNSQPNSRNIRPAGAS